VPLSGNNFTLLLPEVNTNCMNLFLEKLAAHYKGKDILLVMDCAGWHKSKKLKLPSNLRPIYLAPYSPELNPVERFWQHIKRYTIKNKIYETLDELEEAVCSFLKELKTQEIRDICAVNYLYN
jgi:transposase